VLNWFGIVILNIGLPLFRVSLTKEMNSLIWELLISLLLLLKFLILVSREKAIISVLLLKSPFKKYDYEKNSLLISKIRLFLDLKRLWNTLMATK